MRVLKNIGLAVLIFGVLCSCTTWVTEEDVYHDADIDTEYANCSAVLVGDGNSQCFSNNEQCPLAKPSHKTHTLPTEVNAAGVKICPPKRRCPDDGRLPPQPCAQPMPEYYGNVSQEMIEDGIVLIHPYTRAQVICLDMPGEGAVNCAQNFKAAGFVLITDIPQLPAKYDFLKKGTYPTRRWRGKGEVVPRW